MGKEFLMRYLAPLAVGVTIALAGYYGGRASAQDVIDLRVTHEADVKVLAEKQDNLRSKIHAVDGKVTGIAIILDRWDRQAGGPGLTDDMLTPEPVD